MEERFDNYIKGQMSESERLAFEHELANNETLRTDFELYKEVVDAIQVRGAKEFLQGVERQIQAKNRRRKVFALQISSVAIAACLAIGVFLNLNYANNYRAYGDAIVLDISVSRGEESIVNAVASSIEKEQYSDALSLIKTGEKQQPNFEGWVGDELGYAEQLFQTEQDDLEWCKAVTYMRMGKWYKARKVLRQIASSDSYYKEEALTALETL